MNFKTFNALAFPFLAGMIIGLLVALCLPSPPAEDTLLIGQEVGIQVEIEKLSPELEQAIIDFMNSFYPEPNNFSSPSPPTNGVRSGPRGFPPSHLSSGLHKNQSSRAVLDELSSTNGAGDTSALSVYERDLR